MRARAWLLIALVLGAVACGRVPVPAGTVERLETHVVVGTDGSLRVRNAFTIAPDSSGAIVFHHIVTGEYSDGVTLAAASVDDRPLVPGAGSFVVDADEQRVVVQWTTQGVDQPVRLALDYEVRAAVAVSEPRGRLAWSVLPAARGFDVGAVDVALELPEGVRTYDGTGMAEAGWTVDLTPRGMVARREGVSAAESATLLAVVDVDRRQVVEPRWERDLDQQRQYSLALVGAALFILVVGAGVLAQMRVQYPPPGSGAPADLLATARATRQELARGLRVAAAVALGFAIVCAWLANVYLPGLVPVVHAIPASIAIVAVMFLMAAGWYGRTLRAGSTTL